MHEFRTCLAFAVFATGAHAQCPLGQLTAPDATASAYFGSAVDLSGGRLLIGASSANGALPDTGAAYVFRLVGGQWQQEAKLVSAQGQTFHYFGEAVALDGNTAAVGGVSGPVSVFEELGGAWTETATLFGLQPGVPALALDGDTLAVGGSFSNQFGTAAGLVQIFTRTAGGWQPTQTLKASDAAAIDQFGASVALDGDRLLVGALAGDGAALDSGAAYVFERSGGVWTEVQKLSAADGAPWDYFGAGQAVALDGDVALVAARRTDLACPQNTNCNSGSVYVFERLGGQFVQVAKLGAPAPQAFAEFGSDVALEGHRAVIGSHSAGPLQQGQAFVFERNPLGWFARGTLEGLDAVEYDNFGRVALEGDLAVCGAPRAEQLQFDDGAVYTFSVDEVGCPTLLGLPAVLSLAEGGTQQLSLEAGAAHAFDLYFLLGSASGSAPGLPVDGFVLPLNVDAYLLATLHGDGPLVGALGLLDGDGRGQAAVQVPLGLSPVLAGLTLSHAFLTLEFVGAVPFVGFVSGAETLTLVP
jgi:hypothetical protein